MKVGFSTQGSINLKILGDIGSAQDYLRSDSKLVSIPNE